MTLISKPTIVCLLISFFLVACRSEGSTGSGGIQTPVATILPTPTGLQVTAVNNQATPFPSDN